jgi:light-regulated signal transduction histidine kinase (bacteriophytochrome)
VIEYCLDITERRDKEEMLCILAARHRNRIKELARINQDFEDFNNIASHDLKEPIRGIRAFSSHLIEDYHDRLEDEGVRRLQTLGHLAERLDRLVDDLVLFAGAGRKDLSLQDVDLETLVREVLDSLQVSIAEKGIEVRLPFRLPTARCDRVYTREVFQNLIGNAIKYNNKDNKWIEIGWIDAGDSEKENVFYVSDNGIGIREQHLQTIFRMFKRLHGRDKYGGGTGAGLSLAKKLVERHGGTIWVESTFGKGSTFSFTLGEAEDAL